MPGRWSDTMPDWLFWLVVGGGVVAYVAINWLLIQATG